MKGIVLAEQRPLYAWTLKLFSCLILLNSVVCVLAHHNTGIAVFEDSEGVHLSYIQIDEVNTGVLSQKTDPGFCPGPKPGTSVHGLHVNCGYFGIRLVNHAQCAITNNFIYSFMAPTQTRLDFAGIMIEASSENRIVANCIIANRVGGLRRNGIDLSGCNNNVIDGNVIGGTQFGILLHDGSRHNVVSDNVLQNNYGVDFTGSPLWINVNQSDDNVVVANLPNT